jgi:hypothetical protein
MQTPRTLLALAATFTMLIAGCSKSNPTDTSGTNNQPETITGPHYIQAKVNGTYVTVQESASGYTQTGEGMHGSYGGGSAGAYLVTQEYAFEKTTLVGFQPVTDTTYRGVVIALVHKYYRQPHQLEWDSLLLSTGPVSFGSEEKEINGVEVRWIDASGKKWSSAFGTGDQSGSSFTVTSHDTTNFRANGLLGPLYDSKGTFNCRLYDGAGNSMEVTDGKFAIQTDFYE